MSTPAISIVVPVYNSAKYIEKCILSLVNQRECPFFEIVVVNDGTKDNSIEIIKSIPYNKEKCEIKIISQENGGVSAARNTGIANAKGEFICFVDSDDYVSENYLGYLYNSIVENGSDIACCNYRNITDENSGTGMDNFLIHTEGVYDGGKILKSSLRDITVRSYLWNKMYRRSLFTDNGVIFPVGINFEDVAVTPKLFYYSKKVSFISDALYCYVHHEGSITGTISKKSIRGYILAYAELRKFMEKENIFENNKFTYFILKQKVSVTVFGMLVRCWVHEPKTAHVIMNYLSARKFMNVFASDKYYFSKAEKLELKLT